MHPWWDITKSVVASWAVNHSDEKGALTSQPPPSLSIPFNDELYESMN